MELLLLEHFEKNWQRVPLALFASSLVVLSWFAFKRTAITLRIFRIVMLLFFVSGFLGIFLHYRVNVEFELEMYPSLAGLDLFWKSIQGATPTLAPGTMVQLGLLGWVYTYKHPILQMNQKNQIKGELK